MIDDVNKSIVLSGTSKSITEYRLTKIQEDIDDIRQLVEKLQEERDAKEIKT